MESHWNELLPVDRYIVRSQGVLQEFDRKILTLLYQPLVGSKCFSLYMTLWGELEQDRLWGNETTHSGLMVLMQSNLNEIFKERLKLEGMGLLKTFVKQNGDEKLYVYELAPPLRPDVFFNDGFLNIYLYNRVGKTKFQQLKNFFSDLTVSPDVKEVTREFHEVFKSIQPSEIIPSNEAKDDFEVQDGKEFVKDDRRESVFLKEDVFNFQLFFSGLSESIIPTSSIKPNIKETIKKLSFLYGIDAIQMKSLVMDALEENDTINEETLRKSARDWYQFEHGLKLPDLADKVQPLRERTINRTEGLTQEEEMIYQLETISPRKFLQDISGGAEASIADLQIIEEVMFKQKLHPGVVNVLIYYVFLKTDMKLTKSYVQKIAGHWARKQIKTVQQAMNLAKQEHRQYLSWAENKTKNGQNRKSIRTEKLPDWLKHEKEENNQEKTEINHDEFERERKKLAEELKRYEEMKNKKKKG
ncbi:replication initiation and membrane attachment family protein [Metabacillus arenae]|uniref:Replication initiation and membrane attachment family protein n=1 Tax=Metabacillus arenae TaxID=2771434 RepID=A0A926N9N6_9BACI|nr:replication initiation and membrane attachment family protein [Metabacillus arenae]MBD1380077.1 replication initiation and membrane attachment family protein [Metabacillus arenae]